MKRLACAFLLLALAAAGAGAADPDLDSLVKAGMERYARVRDYTCLMWRTEWIERAGKYKVQGGILLKHRKPASFYLRWTEPPARGTESLYEEGRNGGRMLVHYNNFFRFLTFSLAPDHPRALRNNRHTIREAHLGFFLEMIESNRRRARESGEGHTEFLGEDTLDGRTMLLFGATLPPGRGYYCGRVLMGFDRESCLPLRVECYGWDGRLWEAYRFSRLVPNPGLTDADFDPKNPDYELGKHHVYEL